MDRRNKYKIALVSSKMTNAEFARRNKVSPQVISRVLLGKTTSRRLTNAIDRFIEREFKRINLFIP